MARPKKYRRSLETIMQSDYVRMHEEAPQRYPITSPVLTRLEKEGRIKTFGSPKMIHCPEFEVQMKAGFPVIDSQDNAA